MQITLVLGILKDKDVREMVRIVSSFAHNIIVTQPPSERALPVACLAAEVRKHTQSVWEEACPRKALDLAFSLTDGIIICAGSLYLVGAIRKTIQEEDSLD